MAVVEDDLSAALGRHDDLERRGRDQTRCEQVDGKDLSTADSISMGPSEAGSVA